MDILNTDMLLKNQQKWKARGNQELDESEAGFHFIAFVKAKERVWKFDGLERQPQSLGMSSDTSPIQNLPCFLQHRHLTIRRKMHGGRLAWTGDERDPDEDGRV